ncbi:MAG: aldehyde dehydrogenase family protein, partial [Proteobacteria bacterium]|nr:aldehyde dehydrogenase family protein [Pseudomonadota bacterium]
MIKSIPRELFIGGAWVPASGGDEISVVDPATEQEIATVASASVDDAILAVEAADNAAADWAARAPRARAEILRKSFELMIARRDDFATIISREEGKTLAEGLAEVSYAAEFFRWYAEEAPRNSGRFGRSPAGQNNILVQYHPVGVSLLITPWNFPAAMATRKIA